jgi:hypothetical protein
MWDELHFELGRIIHLQNPRRKDTEKRQTARNRRLNVDNQHQYLGNDEKIGSDVRGCNKIAPC